MTSVLKGILLSLTGLLACVPPAHAAASFASCTGFVSQLPATISTPGVWCLKQNLSTSATTGNAITIATSDAVLDCNDFMIKGPAAATSKNSGVFVGGQFRDTVRHCNVQGFENGVNLAGGYFLVEDNLVKGNTTIGIFVTGNETVVRRNRVLDTTGGTVAGTRQTGISVDGKATVSQNMISHVVASTNGPAFGLYTANDDNGSIDQNVIHDIASASHDTYAIYNQITSTPGLSGSTGPLTMTANYLLGDGLTTFGANNFGILCTIARQTVPKALASDNVISGFKTGCTDCLSDSQNDFTH